MLDAFRLDGSEILVVSPTPTWPLDHGNRKRVFSVCNALKKRGAIIHFVYYPSEGDWRGKYPKNATKKMQEQWDYYYKVTPSVHLHISPKGDNHLIDEWWDEALENEIKWLTSVNHFDAIIVNYTWLSKALEFVPKSCLKVLDTHDRFSNRGELLLENAIKKEFFYTTQSEETKALVRANLVWAIKEEEEIFFRKLLSNFDYDAAIKEAKEDDARLLRRTGMEVMEEEKEYPIVKDTVVDTLLHVENVNDFIFNAPYKDNKYLTVGIIGAFNNINLVNTKAFLEVALPIFEKYMVPVKILLAGSMCKGLTAIDHPFITQLGKVESLNTFYEQIDIALVPMTFSTGLKIKAGEALAYGVPLMAHAHAFEGYPSFHKWQVLESLEEISEAIVKVAYDTEEIEYLREASQKSQEALFHDVDATLDSFVSMMKDHKKTALVILPEIASGDYVLQKLQIENVIKILNANYRIIFYFPHALTDEILVYLEAKSSDGLVVCKDESKLSEQVWSGVSLRDIYTVWPFELLWNLSELTIEKSEFTKPFHYFFDKSFATSSQQSIDTCCDVLVQANMPERTEMHSYLDWQLCPLSGRIEEIYKDLWQETPAEESNAIYLMLSGTREQILFWYKVYTLMFSDVYNLYWIIDSEEMDLTIENRLDPKDVANDYVLLKESARCGVLINLGRSNLLSTIAWTFYICKRRIYDLEEVSLNEGVLKLATVYQEMKRSFETLDLNNYNNRFQHNIAVKVEFEEIMAKLKSKKIKYSLK